MHCGKILTSIFQQFFANINKFFFWREEWALDYNFMIFKIFLIVPNFLRSYVLSPLESREATLIYNVYYQQSRFVSLALKREIGKVSETLKILCPSLSANFLCLFFMPLLEQYFFSWKLLYFSEKTSWTKLESPSIPNFDFSGKIGKVVIN